MSNSVELFHIRVREWEDGGERVKYWEDIKYTTIYATWDQIVIYAKLRSQETMMEVRVNRSDSFQGHYFGGTVHNTRTITKAVFGP